MDGTNCSFEVLTSGRTTPAPWEALIEPSNIFAHPGEVRFAALVDPAQHLAGAERLLALRREEALETVSVQPEQVVHFPFGKK